MINNIFTGLLYFVSTAKAGCFWVVLYGMCIMALLGGLWAAYYLTTLWRW